MPLQVQLSARKVLVPALCACCGADLGREPLAVTLDEGLRVSHCEQCEAHFKEEANANSTLGILIFFLSFAAPCFLGAPGIGLTVLGLVVFLILQFRAARKARPKIDALRTPHCVASNPKQGLAVVKQGGTQVRFTFKQEALGLAFTDLNRDKVVNASHELLERAAQTRKQRGLGASRAELPAVTIENHPAAQASVMHPRSHACAGSERCASA
jgi:hypothetical protein